MTLKVAEEVIERVHQEQEDSFDYFRFLNENLDTLPTRDTIPYSIEYRI